jgi:hypothetical protein
MGASPKMEKNEFEPRISFSRARTKPLVVEKIKRRRVPPMAYSIRVRRKTGVWQTEPTIRRGNPPKVDDEIEVNLRRETIKARVTVITTNPSKAKGQPAIEVHAEEI